MVEVDENAWFIISSFGIVAREEMTRDELIVAMSLISG